MQAENVGTFSLDENVWQGLTLTESAVKQIKNLMKQDEAVQGLRLGVKQSGCAGFGYVLDLVQEFETDDLVFERDGAKLYVPLKAMPFIDGTELDFVREGLNQIFKFNNPRAQHACGCGESFGI
ncbi:MULTISPECIES: Fe-S cluster assembly scaffold SufA [Pectobacterium]|jgi:Fe-S cluster assembly protein SufA|uniref:Fe-S cluster assembly scaffold SufA n=2 Tax=Pectobacterium TaxID=122277 RepID=A0ABD6VKK4_9GAMM|nr:MULTISPECIES: Fe-S cluster assembly scaffold SufA [Pectobacterium]AIU88802.1 iron-sulfur cluster assembly scaffold protein [Pectobacterium odoriferum]ASN86086.1 Fe-S cluster assembly scaffold protein SufA [Pectobacterium versatile]AVT58382.1 iron-sulfur cluster assembly scaffold protein [Pectobacterium versatile]AZK63220.1 Fe-S cluster assembly scaffold SufA [Pectobacterium versatile]KGA38211.1 iron-sulfur cluster assembly scaffold protein [Pectobacterium odoriferum]